MYQRRQRYVPTSLLDSFVRILRTHTYTSSYYYAHAAVISRQFREMSRARIESLLASFPKLIPTNTQHTSVETPDVRYVYQPLEDLYIVLITNKASNILQDIETLHLFARVVSDMCRSADQREILKNSFELLGAFDEIVSLGYREMVNLMQIRSVLEMESHEEKIQEIIARVSVACCICLSISLPGPLYLRSLTVLSTTNRVPSTCDSLYPDDGSCRTKKRKRKKNSNAAPNNSKCNAANNKSAQPQAWAGAATAAASVQAWAAAAGPREATHPSHNDSTRPRPRLVPLRLHSRR